MVFKTIVENVKSFFQREERLEKEPRKLGESAIELYEKPLSEVRGHNDTPVVGAGADPALKASHIVDHKLPTEASGGVRGAPSPTTGLIAQSASPSQAPSATTRPTTTRSTPLVQASTPTPAPAPSHTLTPSTSTSGTHVVEEDIHSQIAEFEAAINGIPQDGDEEGEARVASELPTRASTSSDAPNSSLHAQTPGFFDALAQTLQERGGKVDPVTLSGVVEQMKAHHEERRVLAEEEARLQQLEGALAGKLAELRSLEADWAAKQQERVLAEKRSGELEEEILSRTKELRDLIGAVQSHEEHVHEARAVEAESASVASKASSTVDAVGVATHEGVGAGVVASGDASVAPEAFVFQDGSRVSSLSSLRESLLVMDDALFYHHVTPERNDFADWIAGVFKDEVLAAKARRARSKYDLARLLEGSA